jgi:hypothetical protein
MELNPCPGCGGHFKISEGDSHRYIGATPGCWAVFHAVLEREYSDPAYAVYHNRTVDAYAVQHPGTPSPQSTQSVGVHLLGLYLAIELGLDSLFITKLMGRALDEIAFHWLTPPTEPHTYTIQYVYESENAEDHVARVKSYSYSIWSAWKDHHSQVIHWAGELGF